MRPVGGLVFRRWVPIGFDTTVATETLRAGGRLAEVGQLLRQHSAAATSILCQGRPACAVRGGSALARWCGMSDLRQSLEDYLTVRRSLGYKLEDAGRVLRSFVGFADQAGAGSITSELALRRATQPVNTSSIWLVHRLSIVRGFASYLQTTDAATEIPPAELLSAAGYRPAPPYLYSEADIAALMTAARQLPSPLRAVTFETLIGLLAVTGIRIGEAMCLDRDDVACPAGPLSDGAGGFAAYLATTSGQATASPNAANRPSRAAGRDRGHVLASMALTVITKIPLDSRSRRGHTRRPDGQDHQTG